MKKQIRIFHLYEEELCNKFLETLHPDQIKDIKLSSSHSTHAMYGQIMVIYLTD